MSGEYREPTTYFPGVAGLNGTAADYFKFCQMLLNGGEYDGQRLLGRMTVDMMITNQQINSARALEIGLVERVFPADFIQSWQ